MIKLDKKIEEMLLQMGRDGEYCNWDEGVVLRKKYVSQIKQVILKEIMKKMPKRMRHITNTKGEMNTGNSEWDKIANAVQEEIDIKNKMIDRFEVVIKNLLTDTNRNLKLGK